MNIDDIIENDGESTNLDFKKEEYKKSSYSSLIKDVLSMANALNPDVKRIILGVKHKPDGSKEFIGLNNITDQATLENIIQDNIEPNVNFKYYPYNFKDKTLGIIEIADNDNKPYMMKKDYQPLVKGDIWIRKGSRQSRATREDLDKMIDFKRKVAFNNKIIIGFGKELKNSINLPKCNIKKENFPSEIRKKEMENLIEKLDNRYNTNNEKERSELTPLEKIASIGIGFYGEFNDTNKSIRTGYNSLTNLPVYQNKVEILNEIGNLKSIYYEDDCYYLFEENSIKFNCKIYNDGTEFLEDVKIELFFDSTVFVISQEIYDEPHSNNLLYQNVKVTNYNYPNVYADGNCIVAEFCHDKIRHKTLTDIFDEDLRILIKANTDIKDTEVKYKIGARNLSNPIEGTLKIVIES